MALLIVEVADTSLPQDRLSKARIYAAASCPEYWIVNLRDDCIEVFRVPDPGAGRFVNTAVAHRGERVELLSFPGTSVAVADLLPTPRPGH